MWGDSPYFKMPPEGSVPTVDRQMLLNLTGNIDQKLDN